MKRLISVILALVMLVGLCACGGQPAEYARVTTTAEEVPMAQTIACVPLDDRPNNYECMAYRARALGYGITMPDADLFRTRLNDQPVNANGTQYGNRAALFEWVLEQEEQGCNHYVIFTDQLLSGGLVNSRAMQSSEPVTLSDGTVLTEEEMLEKLFEVFGADPENRVWLLDTVMRLAPTVGYLHWDTESYNAVRDYFSQPRPDLAQEASLDELFSAYKLAPDGSEIDPSAFGCTVSDIEECLGARMRKMTLSDKLLSLAAADETGVFSILFGIDDSSNDSNVHTPELEYIRNRLPERGYLLSGVDDMCFKALGKMFLEDIYWQQGSIAVDFTGGASESAASLYDYTSFEENLQEHLDFFGFTADDDAELKLFIITRADDESRESAYAAEFTAKVNDALDAGYPVIIIDDTLCTYDSFPACLPDRIDISRIIAYSGRLDMANIIGTALSYGIPRYAFLKTCNSSDMTDAGHMLTMADVLIKDICYRNGLRDEMDSYVKGVGTDHNNFYANDAGEKKTGSMISGITHWAEKRMNELSTSLIKALSSGEFYTSYSSPGVSKTREWSPITVTNYRFPWSRTFELTFDIKLKQ